MSLKEYKRKRDFKRTTEPGAKKIARKGKTSDPIFVIQKHAARRLHYDFRLEMEGVLKSWAVPKGFPTKGGERHLAVQVEDHPFDYGGFEGTIAPGNYGAGTVMLWDRGTYQTKGEPPLQSLKNGKLHLMLAGKKLKGEWALVRMRGRNGDDEKPQWLLFKNGDDASPLSARAENSSVLTGKTLDQIASGRSRQWESNRKTTVNAKPIPKANSPVQSELSKLPRGKVEFVQPMKCALVEELPRGRDWIYEIKFDGIRALALKSADKCSLISRSEKELTAKYAEVVEAARELPCREAVVDGEVVAVDAQGRSKFQLLQTYNMPGQKIPPLLYYAFDLLRLDGRDLTSLPLSERKELLKKLVEAVPQSILFSASIEADSQRVLRAMKAKGLEGLVAKKRDSKYEPGRRSGAWVKFKWTLEQEFVIGGFTPPRGGRSHFGAILVGYYEKGKLMFASKVGTGFNEALLKSLHEQFKKLMRPDCPFADLPAKRPLGGRGGLSVAELRRCTWLEPKLVCQVRFSEWTNDGHLRQPVFLGLREDKKAKEVVRESPK